jgi:hypothetical protein
MNLDDDIEQLIAYVEGQLPDDRRAAFERRLKSSPELQQRLELMHGIDRSISRNFSIPPTMSIGFAGSNGATTLRDPAAIVADQDSSEQVIRNVPWRRWGILVGSAIAASVLLVAMLQYFGDEGRRGPLTVSSLYNSHVKSGFEPDWACKDDAEFIETTKNAFGLPLLAQSDATVQIVGWTGYGDAFTDLGLSPGAKAILAKVEGKPVMVLLDKAGAGQAPKLDRDGKGKLNLYARQVGDVMLYEITPLNRQAAIDKFVLQQ